LHTVRLTPRVFCIGPLVNAGAGSGDGDGKRHECLRWLDAQPKKSVVFLSSASIGSKSAFSVALKEMGRGLESSGQRFCKVWAVRSPLDEKSKLPDLEPIDRQEAINSLH
jgi:hypothetical protein